MAVANEIRLLRREESLRSVRQKGTHARWLYENEWLEILATELEPRTSVASDEFAHWAAIHFVVEGSLLLKDPQGSTVLLPGDSVCVEEGKAYAISNPTSSRAVIWSLLFKKPGPVFGDGGGL